MTNLPGGSELLAIAREALLSDLRPLVQGDARYVIAMIANAMAIAAREARAGEAPARAALARLDALYRRPQRELAGESLHEGLAQAERELAHDIRAGRFDVKNERQHALIEHLRASVTARLLVSNPKCLSRRSDAPF